MQLGIATIVFGNSGIATIVSENRKFSAAAVG